MLGASSDVLRATGEVLPMNDKDMTTLSCRVPSGSVSQIRAYAHTRGFRSVSAFLRHILLSKLENRFSTDSTRNTLAAMEAIRQAQASLLILLADIEKDTQGIEKTSKEANP